MDNFRPKFYYSHKNTNAKRSPRRSLARTESQTNSVESTHHSAEVPIGNSANFTAESAIDTVPTYQPRLGQRSQLRQPTPHSARTSQMTFSGRSFNVGQTLRANEVSERDNLKKLRNRRKKILRLLRYSIFGIVLMTIFMRFFIFKIEVKVVDFQTPPETAKYQTAIANYLAQQPFERLSFNIDKSHLERSIQAEHPELLEVKQITSGFLQPTQFELVLRKPVATMLVNQKRYFVDSAGVPFAHNCHQTPSIEINDQSGIKQSGQLNQQLISGRFLRFIGRAIALTSEKNYQIVSAIIPTGTVHQIEFKVKGFELYLKMTIDRDVSEQVEDATRSLDYIKRTGLKPQYLDVRVANKVFYK